MLEWATNQNALREANRAVELEGDDTYYAPAAEETLAIIEAQTGETANAIARLPKLLKAHYFSCGSFAPFDSFAATPRSGVGSTPQ
jgi:hypothetical protein